jgi:hypothetical protein
MTPDSYYWLFGSLIAGFSALFGVLGVVLVYQTQFSLDFYHQQLALIQPILVNAGPEPFGFQAEDEWAMPAIGHLNS